MAESTLLIANEYPLRKADICNPASLGRRQQQQQQQQQKQTRSKCSQQTAIERQKGANEDANYRPEVEKKKSKRAQKVVGCCCERDEELRQSRVEEGRRRKNWTDKEDEQEVEEEEEEEAPGAFAFHLLTAKGLLRFEEYIFPYKLFHDQTPSYENVSGVNGYETTVTATRGFCKSFMDSWCHLITQKE
ncbi:hypothetical protein RUM44_008541 [Polyplax serrata]|uniref:Uncharacterized protein n=1 Tax=Polyplax serrata TaxID=468196 RepID=A0ABR1B8L3_POLSC